MRRGHCLVSSLSCLSSSLPTRPLSSYLSSSSSWFFPFTTTCLHVAEEESSGGGSDLAETSGHRHFQKFRSQTIQQRNPAGEEKKDKRGYLPRLESRQRTYWKPVRRSPDFYRLASQGGKLANYFNLDMLLLLSWNKSLNDVNKKIDSDTWVLNTWTC